MRLSFFFLFILSVAMPAQGAGEYYVALACAIHDKACRHVGIVEDGRSWMDAWSRAQRRCELQSGDYCYVRASVLDGCVAFALDDHLSSGFSSSLDLSSAEEEAILICERAWKTGQCRIVHNACAKSTRGEYP